MARRRGYKASSPENGLVAALGNGGAALPALSVAIDCRDEEMRPERRVGTLLGRSLPSKTGVDIPRR